MLITQEEFTKVYNGPVKELLPNIDYNMFIQNELTCLFYFFPLIERLFIETLSLSNIFNTEVKEQGTIRTINSLVIEIKNTKDVYDDNTISKLSKYYKEDGIRNLLFHFDPEINTLRIPIDDIYDIQNLSLELMNKYNIEYTKFDIRSLKNIEYIVE